MARIALHIGPHKTGTTYIQKQLATQREHLLKQGVHYPEAGVTVQWGQHAIPAELIKTGHSATLDAVLAQAESHAVTLLSSENFDRLPPERLKALGQQLDGHELVVICTYRRGDELLVSHWQELVKHGEATPWAEFFLPHIGRPLRSGVLNLSNLLDRFKHQFGACLRVLDYESTRQAGDLAQALVALAAPGVSLAAGSDRVNASSSVIDTEVVRALNALYIAEHGRAPENALRTGPGTRLRRLAATPLQALDKLVERHLVDCDIAHSQAVQSMYRRVCERHADAIVGQLTPPTPTLTHRLPSANWIAAPGAARLIGEVYELASAA